MSTRVAMFTFAPDPATVGLLDHFVLAVFDQNTVLVTSLTLPPNVTTALVTLTSGLNYRAVLTAYNSANVADSNPPSVNFGVPNPPPAVPGDPTLNPPTFA